MTESLAGRLVVTNPKRKVGDILASESIFPYYAGFSSEFAVSLVSSAGLGSKARVLDPWNGSGTTVQAARRCGLSATGFDLNPAMVVVAKASFVSGEDATSLGPLAKSIVDKAARRQTLLSDGLEPLHVWFRADSAAAIRSIEAEINQTLICHERYASLTTKTRLNSLSPLAAFYYVALFRTVRRLLVDFIPTNPTWVKRPRISQCRKGPDRSSVERSFLAEVQVLSAALGKLGALRRGASGVLLGNSETLGLPDQSIDFVLTSPPYCTRIDYAVATSLELAVLRVQKDDFELLRRRLMGTSTVDINRIEVKNSWGETCQRFLNDVYAHSSKASRTYYYKSHLQYFASLESSLREIARVLKPDSLCSLVIQDSHYKDIHNDVPTIASEMAAGVGLRLGRREDFVSSRSMVVRNKRAKKYLEGRKLTESVMCFERVG